MINYSTYSVFKLIFIQHTIRAHEEDNKVFILCLIIRCLYRVDRKLFTLLSSALQCVVTFGCTVVKNREKMFMDWFD